MRRKDLILVATAVLLVVVLVSGYGLYVRLHERVQVMEELEDVEQMGEVDTSGELEEDAESE